MTVNYTTPAAKQLHPVAGVRLGTAEAGIRKADRQDLTLIALDTGCRVSGVFTQNRFCAAPVHLCRKHLSGSEEIRALVINTGIANAGTGEQGMQTAQATCEAVARLLKTRSIERRKQSNDIISQKVSQTFERGDNRSTGASA